jgi:hypothetical protein
LCNEWIDSCEIGLPRLQSLFKHSPRPQLRGRGVGKGYLFSAWRNFRGNIEWRCVCLLYCRREDPASPCFGDGERRERERAWVGTLLGVDFRRLKERVGKLAIRRFRVNDFLSLMKLSSPWLCRLGRLAGCCLGMVGAGIEDCSVTKRDAAWIEQVGGLWIWPEWKRGCKTPTTRRENEWVGMRRAPRLCFALWIG